MDPSRHGFGNSYAPVHSRAATRASDSDDARLIDKKSADGVFAKIPEGC